MTAPQTEDNKILAALALALVDQPRANLQELAKAIGISKATLYRFCRTRDELIQRLLNHSTQAISNAIESADLNNAPPLEALRRLIANNLECRELSSFLMYYWKPGKEPTTAELAWEQAIDGFFLRGQQVGVFRIDIAAAALTELWVSVLLGLLDAERRGRVARGGLAALVERAFLHGAGTGAPESNDTLAVR